MRAAPGGPGDGGRAGRGAGMRGKATDNGTLKDTRRLDAPEPQQTREAALGVGEDKAGRAGAQPPCPLSTAPTSCRPTTRPPPQSPYPGPGCSQDWCRLLTSSSSACCPRRLLATVSAAMALGLPGGCWPISVPAHGGPQTAAPAGLVLNLQLSPERPGSGFPATARQLLASGQTLGAWAPLGPRS